MELNNPFFEEYIVKSIVFEFKEPLNQALFETIKNNDIVLPGTLEILSNNKSNSNRRKLK